MKIYDDVCSEGHCTLSLATTTVDRVSVTSNYTLLYSYHLAYSTGASKIITKSTKLNSSSIYRAKLIQLNNIVPIRFILNIQKDMIAHPFAKPKSPYNYASIEANHLGVY